MLLAVTVCVFQPQITGPVGRRALNTGHKTDRNVTGSSQRAARLGRVSWSTCAYLAQDLLFYFCVWAAGMCVVPYLDVSYMCLSQVDLLRWFDVTAAAVWVSKSNISQFRSCGGSRNRHVELRN